VNLSNFNIVFGWRKYSWVDENFREIVTSVNGIEQNPRILDYIKVFVRSTPFKQDQVLFYTSKTIYKNNSLKLIATMVDNKDEKYAGSVVLSYDIATIIRRLSSGKKNYYTNFLILDDQLKVVAQSKPLIEDIIDSEEALSIDLQEALKKFDIMQVSSKEISYLNMFNGVNYYIKKVNELPFILVVNIDSDEIKNNILDSVIKKFIEVAIFAAIFLLIVITIFRRETWLREKAEQAMNTANKAVKAKSDFLALTAHEIRSPLGFILTGSEMMTKELFGKIPKEYKNYAEGIHQNSKIILDFLTDILDENQILEGKFKIVNSIENLELIIIQAIEVNKTRFSKRKVAIKFESEQDLPKLICDQRRILQVLSNLISNAIKYSKDNTTILIKTQINDEKLEVIIIDQGIGMSKEDIVTALSIYGVVRKKHHGFIDSYGLGLPIVKMLLDAHEAELLISSEQKEGTTVTIIFPKFKLIYNIQEANQA
jgi:signal transduction histidine kinase